MSKFKLGNSYSLVVLILVILVIWIIRVISPVDNTLTWDVFGYYLWLPAKFVHNDIWLDNIDWVKLAIEKHNVSGSLYQAYIGPNGTWMYWFLLGMGLMYMPFFFIALFWAKTGGYEVDGFSMPFQYCIAYGSVVYTTIGLIFTWKILKRYFSEITIGAVLLILVLGTNYLHFTAIGGSATSNYLFTLLSILIWLTIKWHEKQKLLYAIIIGFVCALIVLIKPSEIFCILIPILWGCSNKVGLKNKIELIRKNWWHIAFMVVVGLMVLSPQLYYWKQESGKWIYDSYKNPGIGLDIFKPHILNVLFSFRKGWLVYTPIMVFALFGFWHLYKKRKDIFFPIIIYFIVSFYIIASWTEWWYGGGFGQRPLISNYAVLLFPLGFFIESLRGKKYLFGVVLVIFGLLISLNLFQTWQYNNYIISPDRMSMKYYFKVFGKVSINPEDQNLLLVERSYSVVDNFRNEGEYICRNFGLYDFEGDQYTEFEKYYYKDTTHGGLGALIMDSTLEFSPEIRTTYSGLTPKDYVWIKASVWVFFTDSAIGDLPLLTITTEHKGGSYKYRNIGLKQDETSPGVWRKMELIYQTPEIRDEDDQIIVYVWNRSKMKVIIDDLRADVYIPK